MSKEDPKPDETTLIRIAQKYADRLNIIKKHRGLSTIAEAFEKYAARGIDREFAKCAEEMHESMTIGEAGA